MIKIALLGNPNVGKTTLFNTLTGSNQYVGNWPGVTVEKKEGYFNDNLIVDLPGIYAMDTFSNEEKVAKNFLDNEDIDLILNIVDGSNLERNLYLTTQLKKYNKPIILAVNMIDVLDNKGLKINYDKLGKELGVKVVPISASKKTGLDYLKEILNSKNLVTPNDKSKFNFNSEKDAYTYIEKITKNCIDKNDLNSDDFTQKIDKIVLNPILAYPIFILIMVAMFQFTFAWVGQPISDMLDSMLNNSFMPWITDMLSTSSPWFQSLIVDGIVGGVGGILVLLPIILALFVCITFLEDSGYMARVAFLMDKLMRKMGLSGKAFIPMVVGFGCTVPAIMSARTLESEKDRKLTALLVPLMSCNARLPVYALFASIFFKKNQGLVVASLYFLGILVAFILGIIFKSTIFKKDEEPFIIELPNYKIPQLKSIGKQTWDKAKGFLKKAGTIIFSMSVIIWFLSNFNFSGMVDNINNSILAQIGSIIAPIFAPLGFGNWQSSVSLLSGLLAKETVISTMEIIFDGNLNVMLPQFFTAISAYSFLIFVLLYIPCISAVGAMKKEYGSKLTIFSCVYLFAVAWIVSFVFYNIANLII